MMHWGCWAQAVEFFVAIPSCCYDKSNINYDAGQQYENSGGGDEKPAADRHCYYYWASVLECPPPLIISSSKLVYNCSKHISALKNTSILLISLKARKEVLVSIVDEVWSESKEKQTIIRQICLQQFVVAKGDNEIAKWDFWCC